MAQTWAFRAAGTFASSASGGNLSPGLPAGTVAGDLLVLVVAVQDSGASVITVSGYTAIDSGTVASGAGGTVQQWLGYKIAGSSESAPTVAYSGGNNIGARIAGYSGIASVSPVDVDGTNTVNTNNNATVTFSAVTTTKADDLVVLWGVDEGSGDTTIATWTGSPTPTERIDSVIASGADAGGPHIFLADFDLASAGSTSSRTGTLSVGGARIGRTTSFRQFITTQKTISATETATASRSMIKTRLKTIAATETATASISRARIASRTISAVETATASISRALTRARSISASSAPIATLTRVASHFRTIAATAMPAASLSRLATHFRTISASSSPAASLVRAFVYSKAIAATAVGVATITLKSVVGVTISATAGATASMSRLATYLRSISATSAPAASSSRVATYLRSINAVAGSNASTASQPVIGRTISAVAVGVASLVALPLGAAFGIPTRVRALYRELRARARF